MAQRVSHNHKNKREGGGLPHCVGKCSQRQTPRRREKEKIRVRVLKNKRKKVGRHRKKCLAVEPKGGLRNWPNNPGRNFRKIKKRGGPDL